MAAAGPVRGFISVLVLDYSIIIISENRHLGRASINCGGFIPNSPFGNRYNIELANGILFLLKALGVFMHPLKRFIFFCVPTTPCFYLGSAKVFTSALPQFFSSFFK